MRLSSFAAAALALALAACGAEGGPTMKPGENCLGCHNGSGDAPRFTAAGTVYGSADAPAGAGLSGVTVHLTGSRAGETVTLTTNSVGNFFTEATLTPTIAIELTSGTLSGSMAAASGGACASCHYPGTTSGPAGRVFVQ
jgi:hypothetical protein